MKRRYILIIWSILLTLLPLLNGCIREEEFDNTPQGNFEALWKIIDEQYCFLDYKQIDWDAIHDKYQPLITPGMSYDGLFEILGNMLAELKDGHVNLYSSSNMARYWDWYLDYPRNFNESIIEKYLGRDYRIAGGAKYTILEDNIGYIYYGDFSSGIGNGNLDEILLYLSACNGLIIDVRNNDGGLGDVTDKIYSFIANKPVVVSAYEKAKKTKEMKTLQFSTNYAGMTELFPDFEPVEGKEGYYNRSAEGRLIVPDSVTNYKGRVYVLVNERSASAAASIAALVMKEGRGTIIGRETRTGYHHMTAEKFAETLLPHSQIKIKKTLIELGFDTDGA